MYLNSKGVDAKNGADTLSQVAVRKPATMENRLMTSLGSFLIQRPKDGHLVVTGPERQKLAFMTAMSLQLVGIQLGLKYSSHQLKYVPVVSPMIKVETQGSLSTSLRLWFAGVICGTKTGIGHILLAKRGFSIMTAESLVTRVRLLNLSPGSRMLTGLVVLMVMLVMVMSIVLSGIIGKIVPDYLIGEGFTCIQ